MASVRRKKVANRGWHDARYANDMASKLLVLPLLVLLAACGGSRFSADTPVAAAQPRTSAFFEGKRAGEGAASVPRDAWLDQVDLISAKDRSVCFRATVRQSPADDVSGGQWEIEVNDAPAVVGKELVAIRDYGSAGETVRAQGVPGDQVVHTQLPAPGTGTARIYERQLAFCRGFVDGLPQQVEVDITLKRNGARDSHESFEWDLHATR